MMLRDRRRRVLGVPIGRRRRSMPAAGWAGAGLAAAAASVPIAQRAGRTVSRGREFVDQGKEMAGHAEQAIGTARQFQDAVSSHSSTIGKVGAVVNQARKLGKSDGKDSKPRLAHLIEEHTDIGVPRSVAYNQWTQLEMFPAIVKGVESVEQQEDDKAEWTSKIGPVRRHWPARITEQIPDEKIAWQSEGGPTHQGVVTFHSLDEQLTRVLVQIQYKPSGPIETVGNTLRIQRRRVRRDLRLFKHFIEMEGQPTGEWRGRIGDSDGNGDGDRRGGDHDSPNRREDSHGDEERGRLDDRDDQGDDRNGGEDEDGRSQPRGRRRPTEKQDTDGEGNRKDAASSSESRGSRAASSGSSRKPRSQTAQSNGRSTGRRGPSSNGAKASTDSDKRRSRSSAASRRGGSE